MRQEINLYSPIFEPKETLFPLSQMLMVWFILLALCIGSFQWLDGNLAQMQKQLTQNKKTTEALAQVVREEKKRTEEIDLAPLEEEIALRKLHIAKARLLYGRISKEIEDSREGFYQKLNALSENTKRGLWLTKIAISHQNIFVEGRTVNGNLVPEWLAGFANTQGLRETQLNQLVIDKENDNIVKFTITNAGAENSGKL